ncbi:MAG: GIY-YIG nuclease family protein [Nitrososphaeraceae archaeon]|nr:GIY-YIG nuclease family protein [Nitrososphaeraceae archaeon]
MYYCYLLYCNKTKRTYTGITNNLQQRLNKHNSHKGGAKSTHTSTNWFYHTIVGKFENRGNAQRFEWYWKHVLNSKNKWVGTKSGINNKMTRLIELLLMDEWGGIEIIKI